MISLIETIRYLSHARKIKTLRVISLSFFDNYPCDALTCLSLLISSPPLLGIVFLCCKVFWDRKSGIKYPANRAFFAAWFLPCTSRWRGKHSCHLACLRSHVLRAYCNFESKQAISITLFRPRPNNKNHRKAILTGLPKPIFPGGGGTAHSQATT